MVISTIALVFATIGLAFYTYLLYREANRTRLIQELPDICVNIEPLIDELYLFVYNKGNGDASNIKITAEPNLKFSYKNKNGSNYERFINDISFMNLSFLRSEQFFIRDVGKYTEILNNNSNNRVIKFKIEFSCTEKIYITNNFKNIFRINNIYKIFNKKNPDSIWNIFKKEYTIQAKEIVIDLGEIKDGLYLRKDKDEEINMLMCATSLPIKHLFILPKK